MYELLLLLFIVYTFMSAVTNNEIVLSYVRLL